MNDDDYLDLVAAQHRCADLPKSILHLDLMLLRTTSADVRAYLYQRVDELRTQLAHALSVVDAHQKERG